MPISSISSSTIVPLIPGMTLFRPIGRGAFGDVYSGKIGNLDTFKRQTVVVMKGADRQLNIHQIAVKITKNDKSYSAEVKVMVALGSSSPHILNLLAYGKINHYYLIVVPLAIGSLCDYLQNSSLNEDRKIQIALNITNGLKYMHGLRILHRDLTAKNVLLEEVNGEFNAKIADFGNSVRLQGVHASYEDDVLVTTYTHADPRLCKISLGNNIYYTEESDIYALGITLLELVVNGVLMFFDSVDQQTYDVNTLWGIVKDDQDPDEQWFELLNEQNNNGSLRYQLVMPKKTSSTLERAVIDCIFSEKDRLDKIINNLQSSRSVLAVGGMPLVPITAVGRKTCVSNPTAPTITQVTPTPWRFILGYCLLCPPLGLLMLLIAMIELKMQKIAAVVSSCDVVCGVEMVGRPRC
jgi:serine/threonine protein kinase